MRFGNIFPWLDIDQQAMASSKPHQKIGDVTPSSFLTFEVQTKRLRKDGGNFLTEVKLFEYEHFQAAFIPNHLIYLRHPEEARNMFLRPVYAGLSVQLKFVSLELGYQANFSLLDLFAR